MSHFDLVLIFDFESSKDNELSYPCTATATLRRLGTTLYGNKAECCRSASCRCRIP